jgi:hypothetical protein
MNELHRVLGVGDWVDPATSQDHILKVKLWTSDFEFDLKLMNTTTTAYSLPLFRFEGNEFRVYLKKNSRLYPQDQGVDYQALL